jgi:HTH-type transcriptional regulator/antitoxin HigA
MSQQIRVLKTAKEHAAACARTVKLMAGDLPADSSEEQELELLQLVIAAYEKDRVPKPQVEPLEAIRFRMEQEGLKQKDLVPFIGPVSKVSEVLSGARPLSLAMVKKLHNGLGIPAAALLHEETPDGPDLKPHEYEKFPLQEMAEHGLFPGFSGSVTELKRDAVTLVKAFLASANSGVSSRALLRAPLHQSGDRTMDDYGLLAWRASVVRMAESAPPRGSYRDGAITPSWLRDVAKLSSFDRGPRLAQEYLSKQGICLVLKRHFKKTYLDGAAMLQGSVPIVALTLRYDRPDNFWFALLHELVHVQLHLRPSCLFIADNLDDKARSSRREEEEADAGAQEALIPEKLWKASAVRKTHAAEDALELAREAGIHPAIVAGRVRHEAKNWRLLSGLISGAGSVKGCFAEQFK